MYAFLIALIIVLSGTAAAAVTADHAVPGDTLYPMDLIIEDITRVIAPNSQYTALELRIAHERLDEIQHLAAVGKTTTALENAEAMSTPEEITESMTIDSNLSRLEDLRIKLTAKGHSDTAREIELIISEIRDLVGRDNTVFKTLEVNADDTTVNARIEAENIMNSTNGTVQVNMQWQNNEPIATTISIGSNEPYEEIVVSEDGLATTTIISDDGITTVTSEASSESENESASADTEIHIESSNNVNIKKSYTSTYSSVSSDE